MQFNRVNEAPLLIFFAPPRHDANIDITPLIQSAPYKPH
ncbi:hypothetical protein PMAG_a0546 [Pseudoalteromonas mariniglutinosa NCIMB 1770]|nr:hypothetical protein [Pseudoalteromonas mariniglutinosa NCIMB 1770]